jgi:hypothetical protein
MGDTKVAEKKLTDVLISKSSEKTDVSFSQLFMLVNTAMFLFTINNTFGKEVMNLEKGRTTFIEFTLFRSFFMMNSSLLMMYGDRRSVYDVQS